MIKIKDGTTIYVKYSTKDMLDEEGNRNESYYEIIERILGELKQARNSGK